MKTVITNDEIQQQLSGTLDRLRKFALDFDNGDFEIAREMAVKLRVLFHNSKTSKSLLKQLKLERQSFLDSAPKYDVTNLIKTFIGLLCFDHKTGKWMLMPILENHNGKLVSFDNWWDSKKIIVDSNGNSYTRRKIILSLANQDGGAHVDNEINTDYYQLSRKSNIGWGIKSPDGNLPLNNPVYPSIRQIAFETLESFKNSSAS